MLQTCTQCSTTVDVDPAVPLPQGAESWACPTCHALLPKLPAASSPPAGMAATASPPGRPAELEAWLRGELSRMRQEVLASVQGSGALAASASSPAGAGAARERLAFVCCSDPALATVLRTAIAAHGFSPEMIADPRQALVRFGQSDPAAILIDLAIGGDPKIGLGLLDQVGRMPPHRRRATFVACVAPNLRTLDFGAAFACGADLTLCTQDVATFAESLGVGLAARDELYRVYNETVNSLHG